MGKIIRNGIEYCGTSDTADNIIYDNKDSGLESTTTQGAIDELSEKVKSGGNIEYLTQAQYDALSDDKLTNGVEYRITDAGSMGTAENVGYNNSKSGIAAVNVQDAIDGLNNSLVRKFDYTELMSGTEYYSSGEVTIQKYGKIVIASIMLYFKQILSQANHQLITNETLTSIGCSSVSEHIRTYAESINNNNNKFYIAVSKEGGLYICPTGYTEMNSTDHIRCQLIWLTD